MTLAEAKMFIRNAENFITVFGEEIFEKVVANYDYKVFSTREYVVRDGARTDITHPKAILFYVIERNGHSKNIMANGCEKCGNLPENTECPTTINVKKEMC